MSRSQAAAPAPAKAPPPIGGLFASTANNLPYNPSNWYWVVGNHAGVVYSSKDAAYVDNTTDTGYQDWLTAGGVATNILTDGELADVLTKAGLQGFPVLNTMPADWGACQILDIIGAAQAAGCAITSTATPSLDGTYQLSGEPWDTMNSTQIYINANNQLPGNVPLPWGAYSGTVTIATPAEFTELFKGLNDYLQAWKTWSYHGGAMPTWGSFAIA